MTNYHQLYLKAIPEMKKKFFARRLMYPNQITNRTSQHTMSVVSLITSSSLWECNCRTITPLSNTLRRTDSFSESNCLQAFTKSSGDTNYMNEPCAIFRFQQPFRPYDLKFHLFIQQIISCYLACIS